MGIGGAGYMTSKAYDYIEEHSGFTSSSRQINNSKEIALKILKPLVIQAYYENGYEGRNSTTLETLPPVEEITTITGQAARNGKKLYKYHIRFPVPEALIKQFDDEIMGEMVVNCGVRNGTNEGVCQQRVQSALNLRDDMINIALGIVANHRHVAEFDPGNTFKHLSEAELEAATAEAISAIETANITDSRDQIAVASQRYTADVYEAIIKDINKAAVEHKRQLSDTIAAAKDQGFGALGTWYWTMGNFNEAANEIYTDSLSFIPGDYDKIRENSLSDMDGYMGRLKGIEDEDKRKEMSRLAGSTEVSSQLAVWFKSFDVFDPAYKEITDGDPVANLQNYGHDIIGAVIATGTLYILARGTAGAAEGGVAHGYISKVPFLSTAANTVAAGFKSLLEAVGPLVFFIIVPIFMLGMTLAFYLPAVPFILWTMALIGWLMLVIESLIAAPLWAAAHAVPEGEGMSGQHGKQGYMLFLNVLMRPPLMVFGFFISVILMQAIGNFIGDSFGVFASGMNANFLQGPITFFTMMFVVGGIIVVAAHKVFGLVTWLPDNVMRWVGQQVQNLGEGNDEQRTRTIFAGAATTGGSAASQSASAIVQKGNLQGKTTEGATEASTAEGGQTGGQAVGADAKGSANVEGQGKGVDNKKAD